MKKIILAVFLLVCCARAGHATVLTFEGLPAQQIATEYGGLVWNNMVAVNTTSLSFPSGLNKGRVSGDYVAFNYRSLEASVSMAEGAFDFYGVFLTAVWNNNLSIDVQGWRNGSRVYDTVVTVGADAPSYFDFNYQDIDAVTFKSYGGVRANYIGSGTQFAMDNFAFKPVPEPGTMALLGLGVACLAVYGKRRTYRTEV